MSNRHLIHFLRKTVVLAMVIAIAAGIAVPHAQAASFEAASITRRDDITVDYTEYLNGDVVFQLPEAVSTEQEVSVIITVDAPTVMDAYEATDKAMSLQQFAQSDDAKAIEAAIAAEKAEILKALDERGVSYELGEDYATLLSGFELIIRAGDYGATCQCLTEGANAILGEEYQRMETQLVENVVNVYETGIFNSEGSGYDGSGMVVAVLDTGLDSSHSAFSPANFTSDHLGMTYADVAALVGQTTAKKQAGSLTVDDVYINEKVPFGYDYADNDPDVYSTHNNHGTHVSGVIVGKDDTITGVAPNAQLVSMKIFSDVVDTARSSWILSALEDCVVLGVDVINMSLGTACGFSHESEEELLCGVYDDIRAAGISVVVAASNSYSSAYGSEKNGNLGLTSNPDTATVGSPGTYEGVLSVASINGEETPYLMYDKTIIYFDESNNGAAEENDFCETLLGDKESVELEYVVVPGVGRTADYTGLDVTGKIALVRRGDSTFEEKAMIAESQGAAGIIIYNNVSGEIKMNVGDAKLAVCSISQDDGEMLVAAGSGKLKISSEQTSGPFISDFSSWGPTPDLKIKPEITAHGGNILSSVNGGSYDRLSGTSMACPNLAGFVVLLRQYVVENFPDIANDSVAVNAMVNNLMMSTADIAFATNGQPYSVRKQGAGLANLLSAIATPAYITTRDADGKVMDKAKLELGDDVEKTGVYTLNFTVNNFGEKKVSYEIGAYVMTEGVSDTKTAHGLTTVTEEAYILEGAVIEVTSAQEGAVKDNKVTVEAGSSTDVTVTITLSDADKAYLDESFSNGMYVEGYVTLTAVKGTDIDLSVPYLAFYGDWTQAPMFDLTYYDTNADELDDAVAMEDKTMADAYASRPIGGISEDYVSYLGSYYFLQDAKDMVISADEDYIVLSNQEGTIHSLRFVWAGMLRAAERIEITITDDTTGEVVFETVDTDVRKSYGDGGSIYPANIEVEFDTMDYNLANNTEYTVRLVGYMDYRDGALDTNSNNVYEFPLTVDFEAPTITGVEYTFEYDESLKKNRLYATVGIYDNHHAMAAQLGVVAMGTDENGSEMPVLNPFEQYMTPVYSQRDSVTYVKLELTDYIYQIKESALNDNTFVVTCYDYALNYATYEIGLPMDYVDFYMDMAEEGLTISPNEVITLDPMVQPATEWSELLEFTSSKPKVARVVNNKVIGVSAGKASIKVRDPATNKSVIFTVTVLGEEDEGYRRYDKPVADIFRLTGYETLKAYYILDNEEKDLGDTGAVQFFEGNYNLAMFPSEVVRLNYDLDAYFPNDTTVEFESSNENIVTIDAYGNVTAVAEGFASVTVKVMLDGRSTYYSETVSVEVKDPYVTNGASLSHYYGNGGLVAIPEDLSLREIGSFAFANFEYIAKTEEELAFDDAESTKQWYIGENTVTKVIIPEGVKKIGAYAFANLTALEEVVFPSTLEEIDYGAFVGCSSLKTISFSSENNLKVINQRAFEGCNLQNTLELSSVYVISNYAFAGNQKLEKLVLPESLLSIGQYAFAGCESLSEVNIAASKVKFGSYAFTGCEALTSFYVNASVVPEGMFYECEKLETVTIGPDVNDIGAFAFRDTAITAFEIDSGNTTYKVQTADYILSADGKTVAAVAPTVRGEFSAANLGGASVTAIGRGAFSHTTKITSVDLPQVTVVGEYGLASSTMLATVNFGTMTEIGDYGFFETAITEMPAFTADTAIGKYAFSFTKLLSVTIPDGMTIEEGVFSECVDLQSVTIGNDVTIGDFAFQVSIDNCFTIESYEAPAGTFGDTGGSTGVSMDGYGTDKPAQPEEERESLVDTPWDEGAPENDEEETEAPEKTENPDEEESDEDIVDPEAGEEPVAEDERYFYYTFATALTELTIGDNAVIGENAFANNASIETITLGKNAKVGKQAFYNMSSLKEIDLSAVTELGDYALSGDVYYICIDESMVYAAVSPEGQYMYTYHAPKIENADLSALQSIGEYAFAYCRDMKTVTISEAITEIPNYCFAGCSALETLDTSKITKVGDYAFIENYALDNMDLSAAESIGEYAFVYARGLQNVTLNPNGVDIAEGAFSYAELLAEPANLNAAKNIGAYAFAYTAITEADLSGAESIDDFAFLKETYTPFTVVLGENIETLGNNPFAMCDLETFAIKEVTQFNGVDYENSTLTFDISDSVRVIDGSLYCDTVNGMEMIVYAGTDPINAKVADGTVRVGAYAFTCSDVQMVTMPNTIAAIGHKAFYQCDNLDMVVFGSYDAPILEEEFDAAYYESFEHIPGSGDYDSYIDWSGNEVAIVGEGILPYYMWNVTGGMYSNVFYGANFVDYVGYMDDKLTMVRPANGKGYDSYIYTSYFDLAIDGAMAPDAVAMAAIKAIDAIPEKVSYEDRAMVENARAAYSKIATTLQQALVTNYVDLISAEQRITALTPTEEGEGTADSTEPTEAPAVEKEGSSGGILIAVVVIAAVAAAAVVLKKKFRCPCKKAAAEEAEEEPAVEEQEPAGEEAAEEAEPAENEEPAQTEE